MKLAKAYIPIEKTAQCNKCQSEMVGWMKSKKGKWYMVDVWCLGKGELVAVTFPGGKGVPYHKCN